MVHWAMNDVLLNSYAGEMMVRFSSSTGGSIMASSITGHALSHRLRDALSAGEFTLVYQPVARADDGTIVAVEALARLATPGLQDLGPDAFLPQLFRLGFASTITELTLQTALADLETLAGLLNAPDLSLAINMSPPQLRYGLALVSQIESALVDASVDPGRLTLEIVEELAVPQRSLVAGPLAAVRSLGVKLALDDFGTNRSSLDHLMDLEVDQIKIDQRFVTGAMTNRRARVATESLVGISATLDLDVVAEGVESNDLVRWLAGLGDVYVQGWAVARPISLRDGEIIDHQSPAEVDPALDLYLGEIEDRLLVGSVPSLDESAAILDQLAAVRSSGPLRARAERAQSWLLHVVDTTAGALGNHEIAATRTLRAGDVPRATTEYSRAALAASDANEVLAAQHNVTDACRLLSAGSVDEEQRFRATSNLAYVFADLVNAVDGAEILAGLFSTDGPEVTDDLRWVDGFHGCLIAIELHERADDAAMLLEAADPQLLLPALGAMANRLGADTPILARMPLVPLQVRWELLYKGLAAEPELLRDKLARSWTTDPVSPGWWHLAESEVCAAAGNIDAAIEQNAAASRAFESGGIYKSRVLHCWERKAKILADAGRYGEAFDAQTQLLESVRRDNLGKSAQVLGAMLDFDLETVLLEQIDKLSSPALKKSALARN